MRHPFCRYDYRLKPGKRQPFGHKHEDAEEVYVIVRGDGLFKLDDEIIEVETLDAIRVSPEVTRAFEAGDDGLEVIVFGPRKDGNGSLTITPDAGTIQQLKRAKLRYGISSACIGGGQGIAMLIENPDANGSA